MKVHCQQLILAMAYTAAEKEIAFFSAANRNVAGCSTHVYAWCSCCRGDSGKHQLPAIPRDS